MLKQTSKDFRKYFILEFTKQLVRHSNSAIFSKLREQVKEEEREEKEYIKKEIKKFKQPLQNPVFQKPRSRPLPRALVIPRPKLPEHLRYLQPTSTKLQIDLGKLNPLIQDKSVKAIECRGPNEKIIAHTPSPRPTSIFLTKEEIESILQTFSEKSKIPTTTGLYRVVFGDLNLSAVISENLGSKFIIKKIQSDFFPRKRF